MAKAKRRANGEGTVRPLDDGRWEARILITDPVTGEKRRPTFSNKSKKVVQEWLNKLKA